MKFKTATSTKEVQRFKSIDERFKYINEQKRIKFNNNGIRSK